MSFLQETLQHVCVIDVPGGGGRVYVPPMEGTAPLPARKGGPCRLRKYAHTRSGCGSRRRGHGGGGVSGQSSGGLLHAEAIARGARHAAACAWGGGGGGPGACLPGAVRATPSGGGGGPPGARLCSGSARCLYPRQARGGGSGAAASQSTQGAPRARVQRRGAVCGPVHLLFATRRGAHSELTPTPLQSMLMQSMLNSTEDTVGHFHLRAVPCS
eukprot:9499390-Pyramimonas_sp.AAC.2